MFASAFDPQVWAAVPFAFWCVVLFVFGAVVGSFLNVCIHRLPLGLSIITPPSHCPHCKYSIPGYLNMPLITWVALKARCRNCGAPISARYFLVELLTALLFLGAWLAFGAYYAPLALILCGFLAGLVVATFIDFEHTYIPDGLTIGGMVVGVLCSLLVPDLQNLGGFITAGPALRQSLLGLIVGAGLIYAIVRIGKLFLGRHHVPVPPDCRIIFTETHLVLPDEEIPYEEFFYRKSDAIELQARRVEMVDRCYRDVAIRLAPDKLRIGNDEFDPEQVPHLEAECARLVLPRWRVLWLTLRGRDVEAERTQIVLPREVMGLGDVKLMGAIGAFLGWKAVVFSLAVSALIGATVGVTLILLGKRDWSSRLPYGPYIALAAALWVFGGWHLAARWF